MTFPPVPISSSLADSSGSEPSTPPTVSSPLSTPNSSSNSPPTHCPSIVKFSKEIVDKIVVNISCDDGDQLYLWRNGSRFKPQMNWSNPVFTSSGCGSMVVPRSNGFTNYNSMKLEDALGDGFALT
ncbi:hypothetical protein LWI28_027170 [Acer negundo]|uniref:Uncharacterized protein n=1 Tax=Acer negundo TaxID=4023 RepID=A0AAD5IND2_ACENE|nr:hypothetical protein LWI28_027170 [Acer negundo]